jgi:dienelactone hydrolase
MKQLNPPWAGALCLILLFFTTGLAQDIPATDRRMSETRHLDLPYSFPAYASREEWLARAENLKKQILVSAGLWPTPPQTTIAPAIFGKVDRGDHTIEKVYFESYPGFYVTGNLYRPKSISGKAPAVLCPHGHWTYGRLENQTLNSGPARAANFARQGYIAFTYDMVGYVDSAAISHRFASGHRENKVDQNALWSVNLLGLQLWNSIRSVDFLLSLPEVDPERIACTGESGGGTQTFLLTAVDERVKISAPVNMVSFIMQGGSLCENAPNLRIDANNVEIAALAAPRPMILVSATGDWTKNLMKSEYPAVREIYKFLGAEENVMAVQMDAPHNYNQDSREAVYGWFARFLLGVPEITPIKERGGGVTSLDELLVFFGRTRPENELNEEKLSAALIEMRKKQLADAFPRDAASLEKYRESFGQTYKFSLMAEYPNLTSVLSGPPETTVLDKIVTEQLVISRKGWDDRVPVKLYRTESSRNPKSVVISVSEEAAVSGLVKESTEELLNDGHVLLTVQCFPGGRQIPEGVKFFTTYNRTDDANRVQDILTAIAYAKSRFRNAKISLMGHGRAGLWALLARGLAPRIERCVIDAGQLDLENDAKFLQQLAIPGVRRAGDVVTAVALAPFTPLTIYNRGDHFKVDKLESMYRNFGRIEDFKSVQSDLSRAGLMAWLKAKSKLN